MGPLPVKQGPVAPFGLEYPESIEAGMRGFPETDSRPPSEE